MDFIGFFEWILLLFLSFICLSSAQMSVDYPGYDSVPNMQSNLGEASTILLHLLGPYDQRIRPNAGNAPTTVLCRLKIISIDSVTEVTMDYKMTVILEQQWSDPRLSFEQFSNLSHIQSAFYIDSIWQPDIIFSNEKQAHTHDVTVPNRLVRIERNGTVFYSMKLSLVLSCAMDFAKFPMDRQKCTTIIESYQSTDSELRLDWFEKDPVQVIKKFNLPQYKLSDNFTYSICTDENAIFDGPFSCLQVSFILARELAFYVVQTFLPSSLLVLMSWVSFWIDITQAPARVSLGVTIILTMTTTTTGFGSAAGLPKVSYTKAIDVWFDMCLGFVTMSLLEYALVHYLWNRDMEIKHLQMASQKRPVYKKPIAIWNRGKAKAEVDVESAEEIEMDSQIQGRYNYSTTYRPLNTKEDDNEVGFVAYNGNTPGTGNGHDRKKEPKQLERESNRGSTTKLIALNIDRVSRILFPLSFISALLIYYIVYNYIAPDHFV